MNQKILLYGPAGSNCNYIILTLANKNTNNIIKKQFSSYHYLGTHAGKISVIQPYHTFKELSIYFEKNYTGYIFHHWKNEYNFLLNKDDLFPLQCVIDGLNYVVIINWIEKFLFHPDFKQDSTAAQEWIKNQEESWAPYTVFPLERAIVRWMYTIYKDKNRDNGYSDEPMFMNKFNFSTFYKSYNDTKLEFQKMNYNYTEDEYVKWRDSQKIIFESIEKIDKNRNNLKNLDKFYQRGIAIALNGLEHNLSETECWDQLNIKLK